MPHIVDPKINDEISITSAFTKIKDTFGKLDILVNNAGYMATLSPISTTDDSTYWRTFEINLRGTYRVTKAFLPLLLSSPSAFTKIKDTFGKLDILVNNAGYMATLSPISTTDDSTYWRTFEINLRGTYRVTKAFLPLLLSSPSGLKTIVNLNSVAAHTIRLEASAYGTSKFAVLRWTDFLVEENRDSGLIAFCVHPGFVMTKLAEAMPKETYAWLTDTPALAADMITFLTQGRREWLAGQYVSCQWDMGELMAREKEIVEGDKLKMRMAF
ncbi:uncharacterized protein PAC_15274 [Phialocephala subalpina]|uniref:Uncharacterized protein n=1 Tax=Phialocephala subalpina TaxID=576137 RepID=A0A1L7XK39_9HELO|nr:uncharacterized protein PAC_15274 [Phialocephala subalpina]